MNPTLITQETLEYFGITLADKDIESLLQHLNETLEERVGTEITESLDDDNLKKLLEIQETGDDQKVSEWIQSNVPDLQEIVQDEIDILLGEIAENTDALNSTTQS